MNVSDLVPAAIRDLLPYLSPRAFQVVDPAEAAGGFVILARNLLLRPGFSLARKNLEGLLPEGVKLGDKFPADAVAIETLSVSEKQQIGERLLSIYFRQLFSPGPVFLDFRLNRMRWLKDSQELLWTPSGAQIALSETFLTDIRNLYTGFYHHEDGRFRDALRALGLVGAKATAVEEEAMIALVHKHFLKADAGPVRFSTEHFTGSFHDLFGEILKSGGRLPHEFAFLGLTLASLYLSLETLGGQYDCVAAFETTQK